MNDFLCNKSWEFGTDIWLIILHIRLSRRVHHSDDLVKRADPNLEGSVGPAVAYSSWKFW